MKSFAATSLAAALALAALTATAATPTQYRYRTVDYPGATTTQLFALNDHRQFVGTEQGADGLFHAVFDAADGQGLRQIDLSPLGTGITHSYAFSINTQADIAGTFRNATGYHGFLRHADGTFEQLDFPGAAQTQDYGVNDHGEVIGLYFDATGTSHAFKRVDGTMSGIDLPGGVQTIPLSVNNAGQIAGEFVQTDGTFGFGYVQQPDGTFKLYSDPAAPPESTFFISINNRGEILGAYVDADGNQVNFLRRAGKDIPIGLPASFGATFTSAQTLNDADDMVGYYIDAAGVNHGATAFDKLAPPAR